MYCAKFIFYSENILAYTTTKQLSNAISSLLGKATAPTVPSFLLADFLDVLIPQIIHIINTSHTSGPYLVPFPSISNQLLFTHSKKKPSLNHNCLSNYRPVSNVFSSKILEKIVLSQLLIHMDQNYLLNPFQSA